MPIPKFSAFRRKSTATTEDVENAKVTTPSFRVLERHDAAVGKSFDGGARMGRPGPVPLSTHPAQPGSRPTSLAPGRMAEQEHDDDMFAVLKDTTNRGSGSSNGTQTASTENSSRHSDLSTAPSSSDLGLQEELKIAQQRQLQLQQQHHHHDIPPLPSVPPVPPIPKSSSAGFFKNAGRTFSFGSGKKGPASPSAASSSTSHAHQQHQQPAGDESPAEDGRSRSRAMTASTAVTETSSASTITSPKLIDEADLDMGNEFRASMFVTKRASAMSLGAGRSLTDNRHVHPAPLNIDKAARIEAAQASWNSQTSSDRLMFSNPSPAMPRNGTPLSAAAHDTSEDDTLLADSLAASRWLGGSSPAGARSRQDGAEYEAIPLANMRPAAARSGPAVPERDEDEDDGNIFSSVPRAAAVFEAWRPPPTAAAAASAAAPNRTAAVSAMSNKVMTPAEFERYRQDKERHGTLRSSSDKRADSGNRPDDEDEDDVTYEDDEDEVEKSRRTARQRKTQEAHMTLYRKQMRKVTGEATPSPQSSGSGQSSGQQSASASVPSLGMQIKPPSPDLILGGSDSDDDEVPLAILQAHGFPSKNRPPQVRPGALSQASAANRMSYLGPQPRSQESLGDADRAQNRHSVLPAFARNLPPDPFVGAGIVTQPVREALPFGAGSGPAVPGQLPIGGLIGVIANEERSRAMRRGSPQPQGNKLSPLLGYDPALSMSMQASAQYQQQLQHQMQQQQLLNQQYQHQQQQQPSAMMYGMNPTATMSQPSLSGQPGTVPADPVLQMQMQMMQMQMMQMQLIARQQEQNPNQHSVPAPMHHPGPSIRQSASDMSLNGLRHSVAAESMFDPMLDRPRFDTNSRTMSMVQPSSASWVQQQQQQQQQQHQYHQFQQFQQQQQQQYQQQYQHQPQYQQTGPGYAPSILVQAAGGGGYPPSIAPSERSNVGLPTRYRPVSQAPAAADPMRRVSTMSGSLSGWDVPGGGSKISRLAAGGSSGSSGASAEDKDNGGGGGGDDDDDEGWEAMKASRDKKKSMWRTKKTESSLFSAIM